MLRRRCGRRGEDHPRRDARRGRRGRTDRDDRCQPRRTCRTRRSRAGPRRSGAHHPDRRIRLFSERRTVSGESTGFLYPFIDAEERDPLEPLGGFAVSAQMEDRRRVVSFGPPPSSSATVHMLQSRGKAWRHDSAGVEGSSRSATAAALRMRKGSSSCSGDPPWGSPLPALSLVDDLAVLTALANDVGFELVFSRQIIASRPLQTTSQWASPRVGTRPNFFEASGERRTSPPAHDRAVRLRGRCDGHERRGRSLPGRFFRQRPPHPRGADIARPPSCGTPFREVSDEDAQR